MKQQMLWYKQWWIISSYSLISSFTIHQVIWLITCRNRPQRPVAPRSVPRTSRGCRLWAMSWSMLKKNQWSIRSNQFETEITLPQHLKRCQPCCVFVYLILALKRNTEVWHFGIWASRSFLNVEAHTKHLQLQDLFPGFENQVRQTASAKEATKEPRESMGRYKNQWSHCGTCKYRRN